MPTGQSRRRNRARWYSDLHLAGLPGSRVQWWGQRSPSNPPTMPAKRPSKHQPGHAPYPLTLDEHKHAVAGLLSSESQVLRCSRVWRMSHHFGGCPTMWCFGRLAHGPASVMRHGCRAPALCSSRRLLNLKLLTIDAQVAPQWDDSKPLKMPGG